MNELLFSYGTLRNRLVQLELFGRVTEGTKDSLSGYKMRPVEITDESFLASGQDKIQLTIIATDDPADIIDGMAFQLTFEEMLTADRYEPAGYKRVSVILDSKKGHGFI